MGKTVFIDENSHNKIKKFPFSGSFRLCLCPIQVQPSNHSFSILMFQKAKGYTNCLLVMEWLTWLATLIFLIIHGPLINRKLALTLVQAFVISFDQMKLSFRIYHTDLIYQNELMKIAYNQNLFSNIMSDIFYEL